MKLTVDNFLDQKSVTESEIDLFINEVSHSFSLFTNDSNKILRDHLFNKIKIIDTVTFFGGTFSPIHLGHLECIKLCPEKNIVVILDRNPHKDFRQINKCQELQEIVFKLKDLSVSIYPGFWNKENLNPTADWILDVKIPEINFLMGDDTFMNFFSWKNPEIILARLSKIYVVPRIHVQSELDQQKELMIQKNPKIEIIFLAKHQYQNLSSTALRK